MSLMPEHIHQAAARFIEALPPDEKDAMLAAFLDADEAATLAELLTDFFGRLGYAPEAAGQAAAEALASGPLDLQEKLN